MVTLRFTARAIATDELDEDPIFLRYFANNSGNAGHWLALQKPSKSRSHRQRGLLLPGDHGHPGSVTNCRPQGHELTLTINSSAAETLSVNGLVLHLDVLDEAIDFIWA